MRLRTGDPTLLDDLRAHFEAHEGRAPEMRALPVRELRQ
jgi:hypothetical protein